MSDDFYRALEERFRASREEIHSRLSGYRPFLQALLEQHPQPRAFDIGCGRGEWLQLLGEAGFIAQGVDLDESMLAACHEAGLDASNQDALSTLQAAPDASYQLITAFHVVEHLEFDYLRALLQEAHRTLTADGLLILETPNSENLMVGTSSFYLDPTHQRPVPALFLEFLCQQSGFSRSKTLRLQEDPALVQPDAVIGLWQVLYGVSPDYAIVAQKHVADARQADPFTALFTRDYGLGLEALAVRHDQHIERQLQQLAQTQQSSNKWLEERLSDLSERCEQTEAALQQTEAALQQVYLSRSWRITQPVRDVADALRHLDRARLSRLLLYPLRFSLMRLRKKPVLMAMLVRSANSIPGLQVRLRRLQALLERPGMQADDQATEYSPRAVRLAARLERLVDQPPHPVMGARPRLAFVTPLPPERTGIADYSVELLPALAAHYQIDVITEQASIDAPWVSQHCAVHNAAWLRDNAHLFDAVLYQMGNSAYHDWMVALLDDVPGIVVLHDFFLSGLIWALEAMPQHHGIKLRELYYSHGYPALVQALRGEEGAQIAWRYPFNRSLVEAALGVIVHSDVSLRLARQWYGDTVASHWQCIPLVRAPVPKPDQQAARQRLQIPDGVFLVCSYGQLGVSKLNDQLLNAWLASDLARDPACRLVFVGDLGHDDYGQALRSAIRQSPYSARIHITGWVNNECFRDYLGAADLAVQLRSHTRGETSAAVLDCMNNGLATIVNANGSMADLPADGVYRLADDFATADLSAALNTLRNNVAARQTLGQRAKALIEAHHAPAQCARLYQQAINQCISQTRHNEQRWLDALYTQPGEPTEASRLALAERMLKHQSAAARQPQLLLDITATCQHDRHTGIERVAKALTLALLTEPPAGYRVEPVYLTEQGGRWHYRYASAYSAGLLNLPALIQDRGVDYAAGDRLLALDYSGEAFIRASDKGLYRTLHEQGIECRMLVHDLLPVTRPELFPPSTNAYFSRWLAVVAQLDGAIGVTRTVAAELQRWLAQHQPQRSGVIAVNYSHHGADVSGAAPSAGLPADAEQLLSTLAARPSVLMVGTLEPRKGYAQALAAFSQLWQSGVEINLIIVGREGWQDLPDAQRRDIPELISHVRQHPQLGQRLFWLNGISDEFLEKVYAAADGLLAASLDEGFGLPLIEAAQKGLPILARDIPVFREVAGEHARFFQADQAEQLSQAIHAWQRAGFAPASSGMPWLTWRQSARNLQQILLADRAPPP